MAPARILTIDPDSGRNERLRQLVRELVDADGLTASIEVPPAATISHIADASTTVVRRRDRRERPRDPRLARTEVPWLSGVQTGWGLDVQVVNISRSGLLIESHSKFAPNNATEFRLVGPETSVVVSGRVVRSTVAAVDARGVKYHAAAVFDKALDLLPGQPGFPTRSSSPTPEALAALLVRITTELGRGRSAAAIRDMFEQGLRQLVSALQIRICSVPVAPIEGNESIYFSVPEVGGSRRILQVIFEPDHLPSAEEFELLRAAAAVAALFVPSLPASSISGTAAPQNSW